MKNEQRIHEWVEEGCPEIDTLKFRGVENMVKALDRLKEKRDSGLPHISRGEMTEILNEAGW